MVSQLERTYDAFTLKCQDIADFKGDAIVVPCWSTLYTKNAISRAINRRLEIHGIDPDTFKPFQFEDTRVPLFSSHYRNNTQLPDVRSIILAACYVDIDEKESSTPFYLRSAKTTANVLEVANANQVRSIAFPTYMAGDQRGNIDQIVPAMIDEFQRHHDKGRSPTDISLYLYGLNDFNTALEIADHKLRR